MARKTSGRVVNGWLVIDKPLGLTSTQVLGRVRRLTGARKLGHGGTLDPLATGILPVALGEATKAIPYVMDARKVYVVTAHWGEARDTDDGEGDVIETSPKRPTPAEIQAALPRFTGDILQRPPLYSAIKVAGQRAYDLAREGEDFELPVRRVRIDSIEILDEPGLGADKTSLRVVCGKGTYIRSLVRDLAEALGTCGYVARLRRTRVGPFDESLAISLDKLEQLSHSAPPEELTLPVETALDDIPALAVTGAEAGRIRNGQEIRVPMAGAGLVRVFADERLLAIGNLDNGCLRPLRLFNL